MDSISISTRGHFQPQYLFLMFVRSTSTLTCQCNQVRYYATKQIKRSRTLSPHVAKKQLTEKQSPKRNDNSRVTPGPPNSGEFARLQAVTKKDRIAHKNTIQKVENFKALKIDQTVREAIEQKLLGHLEFTKPTPIQTLAIKALRAKRKNPNEMKSYLLAAETGSGKTLAYLSSILSHLKEQEKEESWERLREALIVRSVVFVPTLELVGQVSQTIKDIASISKVSCLAVGQGMSTKTKITRRIDVLITTPGRFLTMFNNSEAKGQLRHCKYAAVDEADTLMDESFVEETHKAVGLLQNVNQLVFCSATIPRWFDKIMRKTYPMAERIVTPGIHKIPRHVDFRVIEVFKPPFLNSKSLALRQALYAIHHDNTESGKLKRVVVFVNKTDSIDGIVKELNENEYPAVGISGKMTRDDRINLLQDFINPAKAIDENASVKVQVLVCTDLMARGIDMENIRNVILYDLPYSSVDLLHRAGRTGRIGRRGRVFVFVDKGESKSWVKGLERVVRNGMPLA